MRGSNKMFRDEEAFRRAEEELRDFAAEVVLGGPDLVFFDETGFSLQPCIPYGWTPPGEVLEIPSRRSRRLNVLGFWRPGGELYWHQHIGPVNADVVIEAFDGFCETLERETVVVVDNASMHTSAKFLAKREEWEERGLHLYYLPTYSPELNRIEMLWRKIKYQWLPISAYRNFDSLVEEVELILGDIGLQYQLDVTLNQCA